ncbi:hypothetical protein FGO68_gene8738 [Halteria grandinella]|uniref:Uncharacterized protein n=1 Tax=Halteria grandinella TaxID=5974 RepID=A0A8J8NS68_HALGN|nr:hypothetical protein FGO68_gene8738 [Halteria grandinella]
MISQALTHYQMSEEASSSSNGPQIKGHYQQSKISMIRTITQLLDLGFKWHQTQLKQSSKSRTSTSHPSCPQETNEEAIIHRLPNLLQDLLKQEQLQFPFE